MYTFLSILSIFLVILLDKTTKVNLLKDIRYYLFLFIIFMFKVLVNGALTSKIVFYNEQMNTGIRITTIPIEDFGFGFSMITLAIIVWELLRKKN
jgi:lycopene cyclase domain-containing protein